MKHGYTDLEDHGTQSITNATAMTEQKIARPIGLGRIWFLVSIYGPHSQNYRSDDE